MNAVTRVVLVAALALVACGGGSGTPDGGSQPTGPAVDVAGSTVTVDRTSDVQADGVDHATVTVTLVDTAGAPLAGKRVRLTASGEGAVLGQPAPTDAQGRTTGTLASIVAETKTVTAAVVDAGGVSLAAHPTVEFVPGEAARLAFFVSPSTARAATVIEPAVQVAIVAANGRPLAAEGKITLALGTNPAGGTLSGTRSADAVDGVATFANLSIDKAGYGYTLVASSPGLTSATSGGFEVTAGAPARLAFLTQPTNTAAGSALAPAPRVALLDAQGNLITAASTQVTVALGAHAGTATLSGTKTVYAVAGVATFSNLSIDKADSGYTLAVTAPGYAGATSTGFDVMTGAASAGASSVVADPASVVADGEATTTITVTIKDASGNPVADQAVSLAVSGDDNTLSASSGTTGTDGVFTATLASTKAEGKTITATAGDLTLTTTAEFVAGTPSADTSSLVADPASVVADGEATTITITIKDASGNPVAGQAVSLDVSGDDNDLSTADGVTDADGVFTATLASITAEVKTITATVGDLTLTTTAEFVAGTPSADTSSLVADPASVVADGEATTTLTITVKDASGNPVAGQAVSLDVSGDDNDLSAADGVTDADGVFTATLASTTAEVKTITATVADLTLTTTAEFVGE